MSEIFIVSRYCFSFCDCQLNVKKCTRTRISRILPSKKQKDDIRNKR